MSQDCLSCQSRRAKQSKCMAHAGQCRHDRAMKNSMHSVSKSAHACIDNLGHRCTQAVAESMLARDGKSTQLRLLVPTPLCGAIIGKGGATIRSFAEDSRAAITVSPQDKQPLGIPDRVLRITGAQDQLLRAVALLLTKLVESPNYTRFTTSNVSYGPPPQVRSPGTCAAAHSSARPIPGADETILTVTAIDLPSLYLWNHW